MGKYIWNNNGVLEEKVGLSEGRGVEDANKLVETNAQGHLDPTLMPPGIVADTKMILANEDISAGNVVNIYAENGNFMARKADATQSGKDASGYVLETVTAGQFAMVYFEGNNNQVTELSAGRVYLSTTAGLVTNTAPSGSGNIVQELGFATSPTSFNFQAGRTLKLA